MCRRLSNEFWAKPLKSKRERGVNTSILSFSCFQRLFQFLGSILVLRHPCRIGNRDSIYEKWSNLDIPINTWNETWPWMHNVAACTTTECYFSWIWASCALILMHLVWSHSLASDVWSFYKDWLAIANKPQASCPALCAPCAHPGTWLFATQLTNFVCMSVDHPNQILYWAKLGGMHSF